MISIVSLLTVVVCSLLVVRVATVALTLTGLSTQLSRFQARSAFTGSGYTTQESEKIMQHPVRRRIIMMLMLLGNAGIVTAISSLMLSLFGTGDESGVLGSLWFRMSVLVAGLAVLWWLAYSSWVDRQMSRAIKWGLKNWTQLDVRDYAGLLRLSGNYAVAELEVQPNDWLAEKELSSLRLSEEGVLVLGIERANGGYVGAPRGRSSLASGDTVILYGPQDVLEDLDKRRAGAEGNWGHVKAVDRQRRAAMDEQQPTVAETTASSAAPGDE